MKKSPHFPAAADAAGMVRRAPRRSRRKRPNASPPKAAESAERKAAADKAIEEKYAALVATLPLEEQAWERTLQENLGGFYLPIHKRMRRAGALKGCWDFVRDDPKLPRVLLIGDSVSGGYTLPVRKGPGGQGPGGQGQCAQGARELRPDRLMALKSSTSGWRAANGK